MCRAGGTPAGGERKLAHARLWLWETLTGGLPRQAPPALRPDVTPSSSPAIHVSRSACQQPTARRLQRARPPPARHPRLPTRTAHLVTPADGIALDQLPGPDPDAIDPVRVHAAHRATASTPPGRSRARHHARAPALHRPQAPARDPRPAAPTAPPESGSPPCSAQKSYANSSTRATRCARSRPATASAAGPSTTSSSPTHPDPTKTTTRRSPRR